MILPTNREDLLDTLLYLFDRSTELTADWREEAYTYIKLINSFVDEDTYPMQFKLFLPIAWAQIETSLPDFVHSLLSKKPMVQVRGIHPMTSPESIFNARRILNNKWLTDDITWYNLLMAIKEAKTIGNAWLRMEQSYLEQEVVRYEPIYSGSVAYARKKYRETLCVENRPRIRHLNAFNCRPDITKGFNDEEFFGEVFIKTMAELRFGGIKYQDLSSLEEDGDIGYDDVLATEQLRDRVVNPREYRPAYEMVNLPRNPRQLIQMVVKEHTRKGMRYRLVTIGNRKRILRDEVVKVWPYSHLRNNPDFHVYLGRSDLQPIKSLQLGYNDLVNMTLDNMLMSLTKMIVAGAGSGVDFDTFSVEPGAVLHCDDINQVKVESWASMDPNAYKLQQIILENIDRATGQSDYSRGATPPRQEFATTVAFIQQAARTRNDSSIKIYEKTAFSPIAKKHIEWAQEYQYLPDYVPNENGSFDEIDMYSLQGLMEYEINAASLGLSELKRSQLHDFSQDVANIYGPNTPDVLKLKILREIANTFDGLEVLVKDVDQFIQQAEAQSQSLPGLGIPGGVEGGILQGLTEPSSLGGIPSPNYLQAAGAG